MAKDNSERIDKFLRGLMTPEENDAFISDFNSDMILREETQITALMIKELEDIQAQKDAEIIEEVLAAKRARIITIVRRTLSIAAMIFLIFGVTTLWNRQSDADALFEQYYVSPDTSSPRGGDEDAAKQELNNLFIKIRTEKDITPIIDRLQTIHDNIMADNEEYDEYKYSQNTIDWYLALAYIKNNNLDMAKKLLKPLADDGNKDATEIIKAIDSLK